MNKNSNMQKLILLVSFALFCGNTFAQMADGTPAFFSSLNGSMYNPGSHNNVSWTNMWVTTRDEEWSHEQIVYINQSFENNYPEFIILDDATVTYNGHGYTFGMIQGTERFNIAWSEDLCNHAFNLVNTPQKGDIAVMRYTSPTQLDSPHSGIVYSQDTLISKWGNFPLSKHHIDSVINISAYETGEAYYTYYRRVTNNTIYGPSTFNGSGTYQFVLNSDSIPVSCTWSVEPAAMFQNASGTGTTAYLSYATPFVYLAPKATLTFTFWYGFANHYTATKEIDLYIPTTTVSGTAISDGFVIDANAVVTVTGLIKSNKKAKTIVPVGTRLLLNGGVMTSNDDVMWQGIEVWGDNTANQAMVNGSYNQGYVELTNGAMIENAICALTLWKPEDYTTTGGIVHATNAIFRNNAMSLRAIYYTNHSANGREEAYNAWFRNCNFTVNDDYLGIETFDRHVDMLHVNGIKFEGCSFSVNRIIPGVSVWCSGIGAFESGFTVTSYCDFGNNPAVYPCTDQYLVPSLFNGFYQGIRVSNDGSTARTFIVNNSVFNNNTYGIHATNTGFASVFNNDFIVGCGSDCDFGIYADEVSGFRFEENTFTPKAVNTGSPYGIQIVNSRGSNDVYGNSFANLLCGNVAVGVNTTSTNPVSGLTYTCNTNTGNAVDFCVLKDGSVGGIAPTQGSAATPAGNTLGGSQYHFYNDGTQWIEYFYDVNEAGQIPSISKLHRVTIRNTTNSNSCVSHYGGGTPVVKSVSEKAALESDYLSAYTTYSNLKQLYKSRIDGGSTSTQVADVNNATPSDLWRLRAQLLGLSPYASTELLTTAADKTDVFTDPVLFEILAANPDELKKDSLINYLENKTNPLPGYMIDLLRQIADGFTARTALESEIAQYNREYTLAAGDIVRSNLNDTITNPTELRTWLGNMNEIAADRMAIASYLQEGDSINAFTLANMLPSLYNLQGRDLADHFDYMRLLGLYQTLNRENRTVFHLTETEIAMVESIAEEGNGTSKAMAEVLLSQIMEDYSITSICPKMPDQMGERSGSNVLGTSVNDAMGFSVNVSPNPASTWTTVEYTLPSPTSKATLILISALGVQVRSMKFEGTQGQKVIDLSNLADGVYMYMVKHGEYTQTGKLVVTK